MHFFYVNLPNKHLKSCKTLFEPHTAPIKPPRGKILNFSGVPSKHEYGSVESTADERVLILFMDPPRISVNPG